MKLLAWSPARTRGYEDLERSAFTVELGTRRKVCVGIASLADLIRSREAANRPEDQPQLPALRVTLEMVRERERKP
jgi:hypothetical protein